MVSSSVWQNFSGDLWCQHFSCSYLVYGNFYYAHSCYDTRDIWVCLFCLGTGLWSCNRVFDRGIGFIGKLLCTTEGRLASCAGHQVIGLEVGWLCTTGTDSKFCAGNLYWFIQSLVIFMNIETELVLGTKSFSVLITLSRSGGCGLLVDYFSFDYGLGYGAVSVYRSSVLYVLIFWYSNANKPCTLFPCSKFSHRVFIWQGFLTRQGSWRIGVFC